MTNDAVDVARNDGGTELIDDDPSVVALHSALEGLGNALLRCREEGIEPADAFRRAGVPIPIWAGPMLNSMFRPGGEE